MKNMWKYVALAALGFCAFFAFRPLSLQAQQTGAKVVFVNTTELFRAHPSGQAAADVQQRGSDELTQLLESAAPITQKLATGQALTPEERDSYDLLRRSIEATRERYRQEFEQAAAPAQADIQAAIDAVAVENGYDVVMDGNVAGQEGVGLVVYAAQGLDITPEVVRRIR